MVNKYSSVIALVSFISISLIHAADDEIYASTILPSLKAPTSEVYQTTMITNESKYNIKVQMIRNYVWKSREKKALKFTHNLESVSNWVTLEPGKALEVIDNKCEAFASHNEKCLLKVRARMVNKKLRNQFKNKYQVFDTTDYERTTDIVIGVENNKKITIQYQFPLSRKM